MDYLQYLLPVNFWLSTWVINKNFEKVSTVLKPKTLKSPYRLFEFNIDSVFERLERFKLATRWFSSETCIWNWNFFWNWNYFLTRNLVIK